jgi:hypothetical protein
LVHITKSQIESKEWRGEFKRGDTYRALSAMTCPDCGRKTNLFIIAGYPSLGAKPVCPGAKAHPELHEKIERKRWQIGLNGRYGSTYLPESVIAELRSEIARDQQAFRGVKDDVVFE